MMLSLVNADPYLTSEPAAVLRLQEAAVNPVGAANEHGHGVSVAWSGHSQQGECGQGQVLHAAGHTALLTAVRVQAAGKNQHLRWLHQPIANSPLIQGDCFSS